jgi:superoxide dismutase, Fe-Mn family
MEQQKNIDRRNFIATSAKAGLALGIGSAFAATLSSCSSTRKSSASGGQTGFQQTALPYAFSALEPVIDTMTMEIHYSKHAASYATNLQQAAQAEGVDTRKPLEDVLARVSKFSTKMRNNAGGHYNHELFWRCMRNRNTDNRPSGTLLQAIETSFGSFGNLKQQFADAARNRFGSGWAWLVREGDGKLKIGSTPNQDNPLMDVSDLKGFPLLGLDVWEHAYYLKYQNKRPDYVDAWWNVVNWDFVQQRLASV